MRNKLKSIAIAVFLGLVVFGLLSFNNGGPAKPAAPFTIYLSFDDGPLEGSGNIAKSVSDEAIKINVFVVGAHILSSKNRQSDFDEYLKNPFIEVGNHSFSHAHNQYKKFYDSTDSVYADFMKCYQQFKIPTKLCRLPGRNMWRIPGKTINDVKSGQLAADKLFQNGFRVIGWDLEWEHDAETGAPIQTVDDMVELIGQRFASGKITSSNHLVLLLHDEMFRNGWEESELKQLIDKLKLKTGYQFDHLSHYPGL